jgi:hypothetical protein
MIPDTGTREELKAAMLEHCTLLPCVDEVYVIFTPFQLRRGLTPDHEWKVIRADGAFATICRRSDAGHFQTLRLVNHIEFDEWRKRLRTGEIRYVTYDP